MFRVTIRKGDVSESFTFDDAPHPLVPNSHMWSQIILAGLSNLPDGCQFAMGSEGTVPYWEAGNAGKIAPHHALKVVEGWQQ